MSYMQNKSSDYTYLNTLTDSLSLFISPLISFLYFPVTNFNSQNTKVTNLQPNKSNVYSKNLSKKSKLRTNILTVDLHKIEDKLRLSTMEKNKLKQTLKEIRLEKQGVLKNGKAKVKKVCNKNSCSSCNVTELEDSIWEKTSNNFSRTYKKPDHKLNAFKVYKKVLKDSNWKGVAEQKQNMGFETSKKPRVQTNNSGENLNHSSSMTRTILRAKPNKNMGNVRLKFVNPVCMMNYGSTHGREYSNAALKAHLGEGQCPLVNEPESNNLFRALTMHDKMDDENYVIAKGTLTDELVESFKALREIRRSLFPDSESLSSENSLVSPRKKTKLSRIPTVQFERKAREESDVFKSSSLSVHFPSVENVSKPHWDVESFPSTLHNLERDFPTGKISTEKQGKVDETNKTTFSNLKDYFLMTFFCFCFKESCKESHNDNNHNTIPQSRMKFVKQNNIDSSRIRNNLKFIRTTESKFLKSKTL